MVTQDIKRIVLPPRVVLTTEDFPGIKMAHTKIDIWIGHYVSSIILLSLFPTWTLSLQLCRLSDKVPTGSVPGS